jgi:hypothetical protein
MSYVVRVRTRSKSYSSESSCSVVLDALFVTRQHTSDARRTQHATGPHAYAEGPLQPWERSSHTSPRTEIRSSAITE